MKNIHLSLILCVLSLTVFSQRTESFNENELRKIYKSMKKNKTDDGRLISSEKYLLGNYISSDQLSYLASSFEYDSKRGEFIEKYHQSITDYNHFANAFESFNSMSAALNVYEKLRPSILKILSGDEASTEPMSESIFFEKLGLVKEEDYSRRKKDRIRILFVPHALTLKQVELIINEFEYSRDRVWAARILYPLCTEKEFYYRLVKFFDYDRDKETVLALMN